VIIRGGTVGDKVLFLPLSEIQVCTTFSTTNGVFRMSRVFSISFSVEPPRDAFARALCTMLEALGFNSVISLSGQRHAVWVPMSHGSSACGQARSLG